MQNVIIRYCFPFVKFTAKVVKKHELWNENPRFIFRTLIFTMKASKLLRPGRKRKHNFPLFFSRLFATLAGAEVTPSRQKKKTQFSFVLRSTFRNFAA